MTLLGIGGAMRSGKDAVADYLVSEYGFVKFQMSEPLCDALLALNPLIDAPPAHRVTLSDGSWTYLSYPTRLSKLHALLDGDWTELKRIPEVRSLLQRLGTDVGRDMISPDVWVEAMRRRILEQYRGDIAANYDTLIVVTGIRFENELELITHLGGRGLFLSRRPEKPEAHSHKSESSLYASDFDFHIRNNGTIPELHEAVDRFIGEHMPLIARTSNFERKQP